MVNRSLTYVVLVRNRLRLNEFLHIFDRFHASAVDKASGFSLNYTGSLRHRNIHFTRFVAVINNQGIATKGPHSKSSTPVVRACRGFAYLWLILKHKSYQRSSINGETIINRALNISLRFPELMSITQL